MKKGAGGKCALGILRVLPLSCAPLAVRYLEKRLFQVLGFVTLLDYVLELMFRTS
jgi:predicted acyltransferase